jgi:hypothetical protein
MLIATLKWKVYGSDGHGLGGKGCTRMRPEVAPARSWPGARFPIHWFHGIVRNSSLEGCAVPHRSQATSIRAYYYIITPNYGGFKKRTGLNFGGYTESNSN